MATEWADDYKGYGTNLTLMTDGMWVQLGGALQEDPDPNVSGTVWGAIANGGIQRRPLKSASTQIVGIATRLWFSSFSNDFTPCIFAFRDASNGNATAVNLSVNSIGQLSVWHGDPGTGTLLSKSTGPCITLNGWFHVEMRVLGDATVGEVEVRVNGSTPIGLEKVTGVNTGGTYAQTIIGNANYNGSSQCGFYVKDTVVWNGLGGADDNFFGSVSVIGRTTTSDVAFNWAASTGTTGFNLLDNSPPLDGTDYIIAVTPPPDPSVFGLSPLPDDITSVRSMIVQVRAKKNNGGDGKLQDSIISSGTTGNGTEKTVTTAYLYYEDVFDVDPHTSASWTPVSADAATVQVNRTL